MSSRGSEARPTAGSSGQGEGLRSGSGQNGAGAGGGTGAGAGSGAGQHRRPAGGRAPGAHRASKADGLIPGFGRPRNRPDRDARPEPGVEVPYPADVPSSGEAGLAGDGMSTEGELTEAELIRARLGMARQDIAAPGTAGAAAQDAAASTSLVRSSGVMALGTLASRVTGLVRSVVLVYAIGVKGLGNSYNYANTLPNTVYNLAIGGK